MTTTSPCDTYTIALLRSGGTWWVTCQKITNARQTAPRRFKRVAIRLISIQGTPATVPTENGRACRETAPGGGDPHRSIGFPLEPKISPTRGMPYKIRRGGSRRHGCRVFEKARSDRTPSLYGWSKGVLRKSRGLVPVSA